MESLAGRVACRRVGGPLVGGARGSSRGGVGRPCGRRRVRSRAGCSDIERRRASRRSVQASRLPATAPDTTRATLPASLTLLPVVSSSRPSSLFFVLSSPRVSLSLSLSQPCASIVIVDSPARQQTEATSPRTKATIC